MHHHKWRSVRGVVRPDGLSVTVFSTRIGSLHNPSAISRDVDAGKMGIGTYVLCTDNAADDAHEEAVAVISR